MKAQLVLIVVVWLCLYCAPALSQVARNAMVVTVNSTADSADASPGDGLCADTQGRCTFRAAINEVGVAGAPIGDAIIFSLPNPSTIDLTLGEILIRGQFAILGPGPDRLTIQRSLASGTPEFRLMLLGGGTNLDIRGITLKNGRAAQGGAIYVDQSYLRMTNVVVTGNQATDGGGVYSYGGSVRITQSLFIRTRQWVSAERSYWPPARSRLPNPLFRIPRSQTTKPSRSELWRTQEVCRS